VGLDSRFRRPWPVIDPGYPQNYQRTKKWNALVPCDLIAHFGRLHVLARIVTPLRPHQAVKNLNAPNPTIAAPTTAKPTRKIFSGAEKCRHAPKLRASSFRRRISVQSSARATVKDCCAISTAPNITKSTPGPGRKNKSIPTPVSKTPLPRTSAFCMGVRATSRRLLNCC
jgi:hypothetical protein